ncbi:MAG: hypothetical protein KF800_07470 [Lysobacter sp.]|nr:hypothetical protein [Lysobacter sp.]
MYAIAASIVIVFLITTMPSTQPTLYSPTKSWLENVRLSFRFFLRQKGPLLVFISVVGIYLLGAGKYVGLIDKDEGIVFFMILTFTCLYGSIISFASTSLITKASPLIKKQGLRISTWIIPIASLPIIAYSSTISDGRIQAITQFNPEEFSTARYALTILYSAWLWSIVVALASIAISFLPLLILILGLFRSKKTKTTDEISNASATVGFMLSSLMLLTITGSAWATKILESTESYLVLNTSFFKPSDKIRPVVPEKYSYVRIVSDGSKLIVTDGETFLLLPMHRDMDGSIIMRIKE